VHRKKLENKLYELRILIERYKSLKDEFIQRSGMEAFEATEKILLTTLDQLTKEKAALPVGHRYSGIYYIRKPYINPPESEKVEGTAFMREDLVSWQRETGATRYEGHKRAIYKDSEMKILISREEGSPVFEETL